MNTNNLPKQNDTQDADLYEDAAIKRSRTLRQVALGAGLVGTGVIADAAIRGNINPAENIAEDNIDLAEEDILNGAEVTENTQVQETTEYVRVEKPAQPVVEDTPAPEPEEAAKPHIEWEETENLYVDGEKVMSVQTGTVEGHKFTLIDEDADDVADYLAIDLNNDGKFSQDEITALSPADNVRMQANTQHVTDHHYHVQGGEPMFADNGSSDGIHNNFEDEKTGENYYGDYAENNQDYNPQADGGNNYASINYDGEYQEYDPQSDVDNNYASIDFDEKEGETLDLDEQTVTDSYDMAYDEEIGNDAECDLGADEYII